MMKNKKGFTLVELMAVIIVLVIIILIAVNAIKRNVDDTLDNTLIANAGSYVKAVNGFVSVESINEPTLKNGIYSCEELGNLGVKVSGTKPDGGYVAVSNREVVGACLTYENYAVRYSNGNTSRPEKGNCDDINISFDFNYTGEEQSLVVPVTGTYKIEAWGASGGGAYKSGYFTPGEGYGGYSSGIINLNKNDTLYINVGGKGQDAEIGNDVPGGYNGGGIGTWDHDDDEAAGGGGGATHVAIKSGLLSTLDQYRNEIIIVAGGGGGRSWDIGGGSGGGYIAGAAGHGVSANQTSGYAFGKGQDATGTGDGDGHGGGGGGYYGGYESTASDESRDYGGGGSGYIGNAALTDKVMYCYNCSQDNNTNTHTVSTTCNMQTPTEECSKVGNGYVRISIISLADDGNSISKLFDYTGYIQQYKIRTTGVYKLEVWGAQGGSYNDTYHGGYGGYSYGEVYLTKNTNLYIGVGGAGSFIGSNSTGTGGFNGGGSLLQYWDDGNERRGTGGGATHIALVPGELKDLQNSKDDILIVAGGGGANHVNAAILSSAWSYGGSGGGFTGGSTSNYDNCVSTGGTQGATGSIGCDGAIGTFGKGADTAGGNQSAGGGGYYGGVSGFRGGSGGSGYIGYTKLTKKGMYCYQCPEDANTDTKTVAVDCANETATQKCAKKGNGYAKISYLRKK